MTPERERELAKTLANDLAIAAIVCLDHHEAYGHLIAVDPVPELMGMSRDERYEALRRIAALARTARVTIEIPEQT